MKNKILTLICLVLAALTALAACEETPAAPAGGGGHTHTYSDSLTASKTHHWYQATCEHGESKKDLAEHTDDTEDGLCDDCGYEVGHEHTFSEEWASNETEHWKAATCTHTDVIADKDLHIDRNLDNKCDYCEAHVHVLNAFGYCTGCDTEIKPVEENSIPSHIQAILGRKEHVVSGVVDYSYSGGQDTHKVEFTLGTNGTYTKRTDVGRGTGDNYLIESYIKKISDSEVSGISVTTVNGEFEKSETLSFKPDHLAGYYYSVSDFAAAYGAENLIFKLYSLAISANASGLVENISAAQNMCSFTFNYLKVNEISGGTREDLGDGTFAPTGDKTLTYTAHYYEVSVVFTFSDLYTLTGMTVSCDCYNSDAGSGSTPNLTYDPASNTATKTGTPDTYVFTTTQVEGNRSNIDLNAGDQYKPASVEFYTDKACTNKVENIVISIGESKSFYVDCDPKGSFGMLALAPDKLVTKEDGTKVDYGFCMFQGNQVTFNHGKGLAAGVYTCVFTWGDISKTFTVTIKDNSIDGAKKLAITSGSTAGWSTEHYQFNVDEPGVYTFYLPAGVSMARWGSLTNGAPAQADTSIFKVIETRADGVTVIEANLDMTTCPRAYIDIRFYFPEAVKTYVIGYDFSN